MNDNIELFMNDLEEFMKTDHSQKPWYRALSIMEDALSRIVKTMRKAMVLFPKSVQLKPAQTSRRTSKSVKTASSSSNGSSGDPDPEPTSEHYSLSIYFFKLITTLLILISVISFVATSTLEVTE